MAAFVMSALADGRIKEVWSLPDDGKVLTIHRDVRFRNGAEMRMQQVMVKVESGK
jgi:hypothetical protein